MSSLTSPQRPNTDVKKVAILFSGGPAPAAVQASIDEARERLKG